MFALMTLSEIYRQYLLELNKIYSGNEAAEITNIAFDDVAGIKRADVIKNPSMPIEDSLLQALTTVLSRLQKSEPIQHITGLAWFCGLSFKVSTSVLIPRPETEELVQLASAFISNKNSAVLDIGSGSGCIPIALKVKHPATKITGIDISDEALQIAKQNAELNKCDIHFFKNNFLDEAAWLSLGNFDVIISNPPYIPETDKNLLDKNVLQFEPHLALFEPAGQPYIFYKKIARFGQTHLRTGGKIFVEIHEDFGKVVFEIFLAADYEVKLIKDMFGKERFVVAGRRGFQV